MRRPHSTSEMCGHIAQGSWWGSFPLPVVKLCKDTPSEDRRVRGVQGQDAAAETSRHPGMAVGMGSFGCQRPRRPHGPVTPQLPSWLPRAWVWSDLDRPEGCSMVWGNGGGGVQRTVEGNVGSEGSQMESGIRGQSRRECGKAFSRQYRKRWDQQEVSKRRSHRAGQRSVVLGDSSRARGARRAAGGSRRRWMDGDRGPVPPVPASVSPSVAAGAELARSGRGLSPHRAGVGASVSPGRSQSAVGGSGRRRPASAAAAASAGPGM